MENATVSNRNKHPAGPESISENKKLFRDDCRFCIDSLCDECDNRVLKFPPGTVFGTAFAKTVAPEKLVEGYKADEEKVRMDLLPPELLFAVADILTFGAKKYQDRNWEKGMRWGRPFAAMMRHMWAWWGGKTATSENFLLGDFDMETGRSHLWHAGCCLAFLIAYEARGAGVDDRFTS